jgi:DNA primase
MGARRIPVRLGVTRARARLGRLGGPPKPRSKRTGRALLWCYNVHCMSAIEDIKQKLDLVELVGQYAALTKSGRNFRANCPFHQEKTPSFFVFPERQSWHCFGACNTGGDVFSFVMKKEGIDFGEALRRLADRAGVVLPSRADQDTRREVKERLYRANEAAAAYFHHLMTDSDAAERAREYLGGRGVDAGALRDFQLGFAPVGWDGLKVHLGEHGFAEPELVDAGLLSSSENGRTYDRWRNRIMFPIKDERGRTTGFGARILEAGTEGPKYINTAQTPVFDKSGTLYGLHLAAPEIRKQGHAVIVEGYMDVIAAHQSGFTNVVASMGTAITDKQVTSLKRLSHNLVLALDSDAAGAEAMLRCVDHENTLEAEIRVALLPEGKDPDDVIKADPAAWTRVIAEARPVVDYAFETVASRLDLTKVSERSRVSDRLYPMVNGINDVVRRAHYLQKLARMVGVTDATLEASMRKRALAASRKAGTNGDAPVTAATGSLFKSALEEYCLTLLLQRPELRERGKNLPPEFFENSENQEVFLAWRDDGDGSFEAVRQRLDFAVHEHLTAVANRTLQLTEIEQKYDDCILRLREKYLRNLERKREALLEGQAASAEDMARSKEVSTELKQIFQMKARKEQGLRS